jgi:hypothetical protein
VARGRRPADVLEGDPQMSPRQSRALAIALLAAIMGGCGGVAW